MYQPVWGKTTARTILVLIAGPGAGFVFFAFVLGFRLLLAYQGVSLTPTARDVFFFLAEINIGWGLLNLLPIYPLDGGQISYAALGHFFPRSGEDAALKISLLLAGGLAVLAFVMHQTWLALLFGSMAFDNFQMLQGPRYRW
jgi:membrane-associated protease RseP (regulator of RpoE activity)